MRIKRLFLFNAKQRSFFFWLDLIESEEGANVTFVVDEPFMPTLMRVLIDANCLNHTNSIGRQIEMKWY